ncbi:MAG TPA: hypothetical protein PLP28_15315, partial [Flavobacteriales bacterium]|nr:hypothetical protein [Flavobacteriales bacterium]
MRRKAIAADPSILQREAELEHFTRQWLAEHNARRDADTDIQRGRASTMESTSSAAPITASSVARSFQAISQSGSGAGGRR